MRPDTAIFNQHVNDADFQSGVDAGMWGIQDHDPGYPSWPLVTMWVQAAPKPGAPDKFYFRFDLNGYSATAPTACPWEPSGNTRLNNAMWPKGSQFVSKTFNHSWKPNALYAPCDRIAMEGHEAWRTEFPELWWQPTFKITVYLNFLHRLLNSADYAKS